MSLLNSLQQNLPTNPRGVWCFWHQEDVTQGGKVMSWKQFKKGFNTFVKEPVQRIFDPPKRTSYPLAGINSDPPAPYLTLGEETRGDITYKVVTVSFYYKENPAIGVGWEFNPRDPKLGYHKDDVEFISIYYLDNNPVKVYFSSHSTGQGEGHWVDYDKAEKRNGFLVIYIARNSHANYPTSGTHARIYGFANDETSSSGPNRTFTWQEMTPSYDWNNGHGIGISKGLREAPPDFSKSSTQRILYGL